MTEQVRVTYGEHTIDAVVIRRSRKTLEIAVEPDLRVIATAPRDASVEAIAAKLRKRAGWILQQQRFFSQFLPRTPERQYIAGETHRYLGRQYRLKVVPALQAGVKLARGYLVVQTHRPRSPDVTKEMLLAWYRTRARERFAQRIEVCAERFADSQRFQPQSVIIRQLKQRWGSMSRARRLVLNLRLIEAPVDAIDYVITHELCHLVHANHGPAFFELLDRVMPDWSRRKMKLEQMLA